MPMMRLNAQSSARWKAVNPGVTAPSSQNRGRFSRRPAGHSADRIAVLAARVDAGRPKGRYAMRSKPHRCLVWGGALAALIFTTAPALAQSAKGPPSATPTAHPGKDKVDKVKEKVEEKIDKAKEKAEDAVDKAKEKAEDAVDKAKEKGAEKLDEAAQATEKAARV